MKQVALLFAFIFSFGLQAQQGDTFSSWLDKSTDPCVDFYQYACGGWKQKNPLPNDYARYGRFEELAKRNAEILKGLLEKAAEPSPRRSPNEQKIGDLYASCMDEPAVNRLGIKAIKTPLSAIDSLADKKDLGALLASLHAQSYPVFFNFGAGQDFKDASQMIAIFDQGGFGLPAKTFYFDTDANAKSIRTSYLAYIEKSLILAGDSKKTAKKHAQTIFALESALAEGALTPVEKRDPERNYHMQSLDEVQALMPFMSWKDYLQAMHAPAVQRLNVAVPSFAEGLQRLVATTPLSDLKQYLRWQVIRSASPWLSKPFVDAQFSFYGQALSGQKTLLPRFRRCVTLVDGLMGEALGQVYIETAFSANSKTRMLELIGNLRKALKDDIQDLPWMSKSTKAEALKKLSAITQKIGYPDTWRDYGALTIERGALMADIARANIFENNRDMGKIGKPVDKTEWHATAPTVNAYYSGTENSINFPAGILQSPFFTANAPDAVNYGAIGVVIGHEITHGFDDKGRKFDANGNLRDWWMASDAKAFDERAQCFIDQYGSYVVVNDAKNGEVRQNGKLTLGENAADNGGMRIAWNALMQYADGENGKPVEGLTTAQQFFLGFAQVWCGNQSDADSIRRAKTDPHSAPRARANFAMQNMPEFQEAFSCKAGQPMAPEKRCRIW